MLPFSNSQKSSACVSNGLAKSTCNHSHNFFISILFDGKKKNPVRLAELPNLKVSVHMRKQIIKIP